MKDDHDRISSAILLNGVIFDAGEYHFLNIEEYQKENVASSVSCRGISGDTDTGKRGNEMMYDMFFWEALNKTRRA